MKGALLAGFSVLGSNGDCAIECVGGLEGSGAKSALGLVPMLHIPSTKDPERNVVNPGEQDWGELCPNSASAFFHGDIPDTHGPVATVVGARAIISKQAAPRIVASSHKNDGNPEDHGAEDKLSW